MIPIALNCSIWLCISAHRSKTSWTERWPDIQAVKNEEIEVYLDVSVPRELFVTAMVLWHGTPGPGRLRAYGQIPIGCLF